MKSKLIITIALLLFVAASITAVIVKNSGTSGASSAATVEKLDGKVVVYYFHRTQRCPTCLKIEALSREVVTTKFAAEIEAGKLVWKVVNIETPGNEHFEADYALITQSLIVVDHREAAHPHWWNLDKIWELVWTEDDFRQYVDAEIRKVMSRV